MDKFLRSKRRKSIKEKVLIPLITVLIFATCLLASSPASDSDTSGTTYFLQH